jgi:hypothetical protein
MWNIPETIAEAIPFTRMLAECPATCDGVLDFHSFLRTKLFLLETNLLTWLI